MAEPRMRVTVGKSRDRTTLTLLPASGLDGEVELDLAQLDLLIARLGQARGTMVEGRPVPPIEGAPVIPVYATRWGIQPEALTEGTVIAFQHPAFGPVAFVLGRQEIEGVVRTLNSHLAMVHSPATRPLPS